MRSCRRAGVTTLMVAAVLAVLTWDKPTGTAGMPAAGIATRYPGDQLIERDPAVIFVEQFEEASLSDLFLRWTEVRNGPAMSLDADVPPGSTGSRSLNIPWVGAGVSNGGHLYRQLGPDVGDTVHVRYYIKYPTRGRYRHSGIWIGGSYPPVAWPTPRAGVKPAGDDRFIAAAEHNSETARFDHYDYWMGMRRSIDGRHWGNVLLNNPVVRAREGGWTCVEHMVKLNDPPSASNGEHAIWLDGVKVSHLGPGFPSGRWSGGAFTQDPSGQPFEGFRWRSSGKLTPNWIWLQNYAPDDPEGFRADMKFDHVVVARGYIGCLVPTART